MCEVDFNVHDRHRRRCDPSRRRSGRLEPRARRRRGDHRDDGDRPRHVDGPESVDERQEDTRCGRTSRATRSSPTTGTGDQFHAEDQFESYRHLGRAVAREVFGAVKGEPSLVSARQ